MTDSSGTPLARYDRQMRLPQIGEAGQKRLSHSSLVLVGCGALGCATANLLVRAGVGSIRVIDRDFLELDNLQRQSLFDEIDVADQLPKAEAAARKLRRINSSVEIEGLVADVAAVNVERLCGDADLIVDGTDNFESRYLINDAAVKLGTPWVYGGAIGVEGLALAIVPGVTPCLRCLFENPPAAGEAPTCESAGVLGAAVELVAALQAVEAIKLLTGKNDELFHRLISINAWTGQFRSMAADPLRRRHDCPCCGRAEFAFLDRPTSELAAVLCGRDAVQVSPATTPLAKLDFSKLAAAFPRHARTRHNAFMLRAAVDEYEITVFPDARAIVKGTSDSAVARSLYSRYIGT